MSVERREVPKELGEEANQPNYYIRLAWQVSEVLGKLLLFCFYCGLVAGVAYQLGRGAMCEQIGKDYNFADSKIVGDLCTFIVQEDTALLPVEPTSTEKTSSPEVNIGEVTIEVLSGE